MNDFKIILKHIYSAKTNEVSIIKVPELKFLMIEGRGRPDENNFQNAVKAIFPVAYTIKFFKKAEDINKDYVVMPLEVQWIFDKNNEGNNAYKWTMMVMQPDYITKNNFNEAMDKLKKEKKELLLLKNIKFKCYEEGLSAQIMHTGPYGELLYKKHQLLGHQVKDKGYISLTDNHDIYLNDPNRVSVDKLRTIIRVKIKQN